MKRLLSILMLVAVSALLGGTATANADPRNTAKCAYAVGGSGCFEAHGDYISASDTARDGAHVDVEWYIKNRGLGGHCQNYQGYGTRVSCNNSTRMPEHATVCFVVFVVDGNGPRKQTSSAEKCLPTTAPSNPT